jgi:hypothetical protein
MSNTPKTYFIFRVEYSQTDHGMVIVEAASQSAAEKWLRRHGEQGPRYVTCYGESEIVKADILA